MPPEIRFASSADAPGIVRLIRELASSSGDTSPITEEDVHTYLQDPACRVLLACSGSTVIGMVSYTIHHNLFHGGKVCFIEELIVNWGHRNKGIGSALMERVLTEAREAGCVEISLSTDKDNHAAQRFYRRQGFDYEAVYMEQHFREDK
jgi:ribosomal protein S18 acetylase RimI-like enzyme